MRARITDKFYEARENLLSTDYPRWRNLLSCLALLVLTTGVVASWWYIYYTIPEVVCHKGHLYFSVLWLAVQWVVIGYLYWYRNIPAFARGAIKMLIGVANIWFGLFIFSLNPCVS